jgi:hypothetical protein
LFYGFDVGWGVLELGGTAHLASLADASSAYTPTMSMELDDGGLLTWYGLVARANSRSDSSFQNSYIFELDLGSMAYRECSSGQYDDCIDGRSPTDPELDYTTKRSLGVMFNLDWQPSIVFGDESVMLYGVAGLGLGPASEDEAFSDTSPMSPYPYLRAGFGVSISWRALIFDASVMQPIPPPEIELPTSWNLKLGVRM